MLRPSIKIFRPGMFQTSPPCALCSTGEQVLTTAMLRNPAWHRASFRALSRCVGPPPQLPTCPICSEVLDRSTRTSIVGMFLRSQISSTCLPEVTRLRPSPMASTPTIRRFTSTTVGPTISPTGSRAVRHFGALTPLEPALAQPRLTCHSCSQVQCSSIRTSIPGTQVMSPTWLKCLRAPKGSTMVTRSTQATMPVRTTSPGQPAGSLPSLRCSTTPSPSIRT